MIVLLSSNQDTTFSKKMKTPSSFVCKKGLNPKSLIQLLETLPIKVTGTHRY